MKYANGCIIHNLDKIVSFLGGLEGVLIIGEATDDVIPGCLECFSLVTNGME